MLALAVVAGAVLGLEQDTLSDPYHWDALGGVVAPALDALDHGFRVIHPDGLNFGHPPLLHLALALLWSVFGTALPVAHLFALACATACLAFTAAVARASFGPRAAIAAVVLTLSHTLFFAQSGTVNDAMPLAALSMGVFWAWLENRWLAWGLLSAALVLTKETGALVVGLLCAVSALELVRRWQRPDVQVLRMWSGAGAAFGLLVAWYAYQRHAMGLGLRTELIGTMSAGTWPGTLWRHLVRDTGLARTNGFNGVLVLAALVSSRWLPSGPRRVVVLALGIFAAHAVLFTVTVDVPRYHVPAVPFLALAASAAFAGEGRPRVS